MTKFETMDNVTKNYVALSEEELKATEGGIVPVIAIWATAAGVGFSGGIAVGLNYVNRH
ncbi:class IIb bacteriocin, lactobin A/cerein 7B family [Streptococcus sp. H49]|uniref:class IIb bacteriocin, lactobin A/cerein 7B family n=1 Tax=Streptococcus huangxiaojuni TaxID=3237239 RepID=UPI0034A22C0C